MPAYTDKQTRCLSCVNLATAGKTDGICEIFCFFFSSSAALSDLICASQQLRQENCLICESQETIGTTDDSIKYDVPEIHL